ncbi:alpha/beta fold hydrolase [Heliobacillus mobilis]|uniref:Alpha/beta fold hydrolase n=1 Tax=Heliobacterium mobile TaxID=28064 RepID=A0A6I3SN52_HELMO|nr:alpha/beta hydrolase [Heliobacterium mobile]MTV50454.1 alpha/beta fold hydrolase [Heliobacterium mobile]
MATVIGKGVQLYYEVHGSETAPAMIFTHGAGWDHRQWEPQVDVFSRNFRVIVWDVRYHGQSVAADGPIDAETFSRDLILLLDHLAIEKAILVGCSMGGHISLRTAALYPERVQALVLMGTPVTSAFNWFNRLQIPFRQRSMQKFVMEVVDMSLQFFSFFFYGLTMRISSMQSLAKMHAKALSMYNPSLQDYFYGVTSVHSKERWMQIFNAVSRMEALAELTKVQCSTLVIEGDGEWMMRRQHRYICECIPGTVHKVINHAGHATNLDNPVEVNQYLAEFIAAVLIDDKADPCRCWCEPLELHAAKA